MNSFIVERFGEGPYMEYRIPGIIVTEKGTVFCCYEGRMETHNDWAQTDIVVCRSTDGGEHMDKRVISSSEMKAKERAAVTWNNPVLIQDGDMVHLLFHRNYEAAYYCCSRDDGATFSEPAEITAAFREFSYNWNVCASGPGHGIAMKSGRLLVPVWLASGEALDGSGRKRAHNPSVAGAIYSDDRGRTWHAGALAEGITNANETSVVQRNDGQILFNFRNGEPQSCRILGVSADGVKGFRDLRLEPQLPDPKCFGSMVRLDEQKIGFINCANSDGEHPLGARVCLAVSVSDDDGKSWTPAILVDTYGGYADLAVHGSVLYVFYEQSSWTTELKRVNRLILKQYHLNI